MNDERKICVGAIAGAFGVHGEVRLKSFCANPEDISRYNPLYDEAGEAYRLASIRVISDGFAGRFEEIKTREDAEKLRSTRLFALRAQFPELTEDEFYHSDLIGLEVFDGHGVRLGKVKSIQNYGAGDLIEIHYQGRTSLIPFTRVIVPTVDLAGQKIIVDPPLGLLD